MKGDSIADCEKVTSSVTAEQHSKLETAWNYLIGRDAAPAPAPPPLTLLNLALICSLFIIWRAALLAVSVVWTRLGVANPWESDDVYSELVRHSVRWDSGWYLSVVREGYVYNPGEQSNIAFFPAFPYLTRIAEAILPVGDVIAGLVVVHLALLGALLYIFQLVRIDHPDETAWRTLFFVLIFPAAIFFTAFYAESLIIFGMVATIYHARRGHWLLAGAFGMFTGLTKLIGIILIIPVGLELLRQRALRRDNLRAWIGGALTLGGGVAYLMLLQIQLGDFRTYFWNQEHWERESFHPEPFIRLAEFLTGRSMGDLPYSAEVMEIHTYYFLMDMGTLLIFLVAGVYLWMKVLPAYGSLVLAGALIPALSGTPLALARHMAILFPVFILAGKIRSEPVRQALAIISVMGLAMTTYLFVNGYWAG
jgi:hypothetical protein